MMKIITLSKAFWPQHDWCMYEMTDTNAECTEPEWVCVRWVPDERRSRHMPQFLAKKLTPFDNYL